MTSDEFDGAVWRKSTYSGSNNGCVEHGRLRSGRQAVRDTKDRERGAVVFAAASWRTFVDAVRR
ncbi:DUF397 domain-containing protein [Streptomyces sp. NPDC093109]|uniref:DUF397 domain-containing protein n=1 Tax=Streptomyces sp. NPDC093109 TaxID=3154977 RepID=UPI00344C2E98